MKLAKVGEKDCLKSIDGIFIQKLTKHSEPLVFLTKIKSYMDFSTLIRQFRFIQENYRAFKKVIFKK